MSRIIALEQLASSEDNVESNEYILQRSMRKLRGMTWSGMFYNMFTSEPPLPDVRGRGLQNNFDPGSYYSAGPTLVEQQQQLGMVSSVTSQQKTEQDAELEAILRSVQRLHGIGVEMGIALDAHNSTLDRLSCKLEQANEHTLAVLLKTSQLNQRARKTPATYQCPLTFIEVLSGSYLQANDDLLQLAPPSSALDRSMVFHYFTKEEHLYGLQNAKTLRFIGISLWGSVKVASTAFGSYEEVYIDIVSGRQPQGTGILLLSSNWGGGGWLKVDEKGALVTVSRSITDTQDIMRFRIKELAVNKS